MNGRVRSLVVSGLVRTSCSLAHECLGRSLGTFGFTGVEYGTPAKKASASAVLVTDAAGWCEMSWKQALSYELIISDTNYVIILYEQIKVY